jgi:predicted thioesterase
VGTEIFCKTTVVAVDGPRIAFAADIWDSVGEVGSGWHERFIVNNEKFMKKAAAKSEVR